MAKRRANGEGTLRQRPDGRWEARYTDNREVDPSKRLKYITHRSQKVVIAKLKLALAEVENGGPLASNDNPAFAEWVVFWMYEYKITELRDSTFENYIRYINAHIIPAIGAIKVKSLTGVHIQKMFNKLQEAKDIGGAGLSAATVKKVKDILSGALKQAVTNRIIKNNPLNETNPISLEDVDIRILSSEEQKSFISVLPFYNTGNLFAIALATGMRVGELCALDVKDVNRKKKYIDVTKTAGRRKDKYTGEVSIKIGPPKTKYSKRRIPLLPSVEVMFDRQASLVAEMRARARSVDLWKENTLVFPTDEGKIHSLTGLRTSMGRVLKRAGLEHTTLHSLRHTYATTALNAGVAAQNVARLLGHKDGATTLKIYAHYIDLETIIQLEKLEEQIISDLGITQSELESITMDSTEKQIKTSISEMLDDAIRRAKNFPPAKSIDMILSICEDILCMPLDSLSQAEKEKWLGVFSRYTIMKRQYVALDLSIIQLPAWGVTSECRAM